MASVLSLYQKEELLRTTSMQCTDEKTSTGQTHWNSDQRGGLRTCGLPGATYHSMEVLAYVWASSLHSLKRAIRL
jgi:hypothetical protein